MAKMIGVKCSCGRTVLDNGTHCSCGKPYSVEVIAAGKDHHAMFIKGAEQNLDANEFVLAMAQQTRTFGRNMVTVECPLPEAQAPQPRFFQRIWNKLFGR